MWLHAWRAAAGTTDSKRWETNSSPRLCSFWAVVALAQQGRQAAGAGVAAAAVCAAGRHNVQARGSPQVMVAQVLASRRKAELRNRCRLLSGRVGGRGLRSGHGRKAQSRHLCPQQPVRCMHACNCKQEWWPRDLLSSVYSGADFPLLGEGPLSPIFTGRLCSHRHCLGCWGRGCCTCAPLSSQTAGRPSGGPSTASPCTLRSPPGPSTHAL